MPKQLTSRQKFLSAMPQFVEEIESIAFKGTKEEDNKRENAHIDGETAMGTMLLFGMGVSKRVAKDYFMNSEFGEAHDEGRIYIHDLDFVPMGTTTCCQIDLNKLFKNGFNVKYGRMRTPNDIASYVSLAAIALQANHNDQHGGQSIPAFDFFMAPGVLKTFKKQLKQCVHDFLELDGLDTLVDFSAVTSMIDSLSSIEFDQKIFQKFTQNSQQLQKIFAFAYQRALAKTDRLTYQAMESFIHNMNTMHARAGAQVPFSSINFGTDTSAEGRMVMKNFLLACDAGLGHSETPIFPISVFKVKEGVNYNPEDANYDVFQLACQVSAKRLLPNFAFLDAPFNLQFYRPGDYRTEVTYMGCRTRVIANVADKSRQFVTERGNLSFTSINLPRIALEYGMATGKKAHLDKFFAELDATLELVQNQLLERFAIQCSKKAKNFPFLLGQGVWVDSEKLQPDDDLRQVLKHGTLSIGFIGLAETLVALIGQHQGESKAAQELGLKIISFMRNKCDEFSAKHQLNFTLLATPAEGLSGKFTKIDKAKYGIIKGVTDKDYYTNSFHIPVSFPIPINNKIALEAPYHALTNAGHITYIELDGDATDNIEAFEKIIHLMKDAGVGYGAINHPVDRDPVCGFTGVIGDTCPGCGRTEGDDKFERIRRITGYLVGTLDRFNDSKKAEEKDRVKHDFC